MVLDHGCRNTQAFTDSAEHCYSQSKMTVWPSTRQLPPTSHVGELCGMALNQQTKKMFTSNMELRNAVRHYCGRKSTKEDNMNSHLCGCHISDTYRVIYMYGPTIGKWNVSQMTTFTDIFGWMKDFNEPIEDWDVSKATNMDKMFANASSFNQSLAKWDTSQVTDMSMMFIHARSFNQPLATWRTGNMRHMTYMFYSAVSFNQPLATWDVSKVTHMSNMFYKAESFNQSLEGWDTSNVTQMSHMFLCSPIFVWYVTDRNRLTTDWGWDISNVLPPEPEEDDL
jgi:surface protein